MRTHPPPSHCTGYSGTNQEESHRGTALGRASYEAPRALRLSLQPGHSLLQVLHDEVHLGPGGAAAHAEPERVPGHIEGNATAQQHRRWPGEGGGESLHQLSEGRGCAPRGTGQGPAPPALHQHPGYGCAAHLPSLPTSLGPRPPGPLSCARTPARKVLRPCPARPLCPRECCVWQA